MNKKQKEKRFLPLILLFFSFLFLLGGVSFLFMVIQTFNEFLISGFFILLSFSSLMISILLISIMESVEESTNE